MRCSVARLAQAAKGGKSASTSPYAWVNPQPIASSSSGPLVGRSIAIKDNIAYTGAPTECGSDILEGYVPPFDATCVSLLTAAGAHIAGKTKMDEFGMGSQNTHMSPRYSPVHNPSGPEGAEPRAAGGSSGGSAAAVGEGSAWAALGTDTGGSVRLPASYCGVVGFKPSYGLISRHGVVAYADSLDCVGILARKTSDVRDVFGIVSQPDENDMTCVSASDRAKAAAAVAPSLDVRPLRIGIPVQTHLERPNIQLNPALLEHLRARGATLHAVDMPSFAMALPAYYVLACAEAASNLGRFGGSWYGSTAARERVQPGDEVDQRDASGAARRSRLRTQGFGDEVRKRILAGTHALTADAFNNSYLKALQLRRAVRRDFAAVLRTPHPITGGEAPEAGVDVLLFPTAVGTAPVLGAAESGESGTNEYLQDLLTVPASLAGLPAISVPAGKGQDGWPVGVSLVGQWGCDEAVFRAAQEVEAWQQ